MAQSVSVGNANRDNLRWYDNVNDLANGNRWDADNRVLLRNKPFFLPPYMGVFFCRYDRQPTSILLASTSRPDIRRC